MDTTLIVPTIDNRQRIPMEVIHSLAERIAMEFHPLRRRRRGLVDLRTAASRSGHSPCGRE